MPDSKLLGERSLEDAQERDTCLGLIAAASAGDLRQLRFSPC